MNRKFDPEILKHLTIDELIEANRILDEDAQLWHPLEGPQTDATDSQADITGFGGAGGGGKSDWILGLGLTRHRNSIIFRENGTELAGLNTRLREILSPNDFNGRDQRWSFVRPDGKECAIELGSFPDIGDEQKYRGRPHDLLAFDEATNMREQQVRFLFAWARTVLPEQRVRIVLTFNPPSTVEGRWIISFFAPWLDDKHPNPALPGELRWFATIAGVDIEVPDDRAFVLTGGDENSSPEKRTRCYEFDPDAHRPEDIIKPQSRTFIPSRVTDNPFLRDTGYMRTLQALPEPLRSQMLKGDFRAGMREDAFQVIPTAWVDAAMARWKPRPKKPVMDSMGVDVAMGGGDEHVIICRHGVWFDEPIAHKGKEIPDGAASGAQVVQAWRDNAVIHVDLLGPGALTYGFLLQLQLQAVGVNFGELVSAALDQHGRLRFTNLRSYLWWKMREALDPLNNLAIELPPHKRLRADLCAPKYSLPGQAIKVQSRDDIIKAIGRSPDYGTAAILAWMDTPKVQLLRDIVGRQPRTTQQQQGHDPYAVL